MDFAWHFFDALPVALLLCGALLAGFVNGFAGFGTGLVASGFWFLALPASAVPPMAVLAAIVGQVIGLVRLRQSLDWKNVTPYILGGLVGLPIGLLLLTLASASMLRMSVGGFLIFYACMQWGLLGKFSIGLWGGKKADACVGAGGGFLGGFAGLSGPLPMIWLQLRGGDVSSQRMVYQPFNLVILGLAAIGMLWSGQIDNTVFNAAIVCLPATLLGTWIGLRCYRATNDTLFRQMILGLLLLSGAVLVLQSANLCCGLGNMGE